jgi:hypothetical protein
VSAVFGKTHSGLIEIETRVGGLSPRVRRLLIFIDGKRTVSDLRGLVQSDDLRHTLGMLEEDGYIELISMNGKDSPAALLSAANFRRHPPGDDLLRLQQARNFMLNTIRTFVGALGTSSLQNRIEGARNETELRAIFDEWYHAIVTSRDGRREAEQLRSRLLEVI